MLAGLLCGLAGMVVVATEMHRVAFSRAVRIAQPSDFVTMMNDGDFAIAMAGGYVFLLGIMLLMADRLGVRLGSSHAAAVEQG